MMRCLLPVAVACLPHGSTFQTALHSDARENETLFPETWMEPCCKGFLSKRQVNRKARVETHSQYCMWWGVRHPLGKKCATHVTVKHLEVKMQAKDGSDNRKRGEEEVKILTKFLSCPSQAVNGVAIGGEERRLAVLNGFVSHRLGSGKRSAMMR